jgi:predicted nucleic acid-binding protein
MSLAEGSELWGIPVFCLGEFLRVVTHPVILEPPTDPPTARRTLEVLLQSPTVRILSPGDAYMKLLLETVESSKVTGNLVFDAQIVAVCKEHGVSVLWTHDRDFSRFPDFVTRTLS